MSEIKQYMPRQVKVVGEPDQYGNLPYSVMFETGESVFMKAQKAPVAGEPETGIITEEPKREKPNETYKKFTRKRPDGVSAPMASNVQIPSNDDKYSAGMAWGNALTNAVAMAGLIDQKWQQESLEDYVLETAHNLVERASKVTEPETTPERETGGVEPAPKLEEDIDLEEIPF